MVRDASTCSCSRGGGESGGPAARQMQFLQIADPRSMDSEILNDALWQ